MKCKISFTEVVLEILTLVAFNDASLVAEISLFQTPTNVFILDGPVH